MPVQRRVAAGVLSAGHARALLSLQDPDDQEQLAGRIVAEGLSVRGAEEAVTLIAGRGTPRRRTPPKRRVIPGLDDLAGALSDAFDTRVRLELGRSKGRIVVEFATEEDLQRIVTIMAPGSVADRPVATAENAGRTDRCSIDRSPPGRTVTRDRRRSSGRSVREPASHARELVAAQMFSCDSYCTRAMARSTSSA